MEYKIVFSDIDGTLLNSNHQISRGTLDSVLALKQIGVPFILVSARMPNGILPLQKELRINEPIICFSGALVLGAVQADGTRKVLLNKTLNPSDVRDVYTLISDRFPLISFSAYNKENWFVTSLNDEWVIQEQKIAGTPPQLFNFAGNNHPTMNKLLCMGPPQAIDSLETELKRYHPEITIYKSKPTYLEIMARDVQKSSAIMTLLESYHVTKQEIIAIGDNYNDIDMIRFAGLGVAMGNSPDEVKASAHIITLANDEDGVKDVIERYCLQLK
ncbi:putative phosphatase [compost metagenome]